MKFAHYHRINGLRARDEWGRLFCPDCHQDASDTERPAESAVADQPPILPWTPPRTRRSVTGT